MAKKKRKKIKISDKSGLPPGTPVFIGEVKVEEATFSIIGYNQAETQSRTFEQDEINKIDFPSDGIHWVNINGLHDIKSIQEICERWSIHQLIVEDIVNTNHRPKVEIFDDYIFLITKMYFYQPQSKSILSEQVSFVLKGNIVLSFQEKPGDVFGPVRARIKNNGRLRKLGSDYLFYSLLDCLVDSHFSLLENIDEDLEYSEELILHNPNTATLSSFFALKRSLLLLRKSIWPLREVASQLTKGDSELIQESTEPYLRDLYEHVIQVIESVETFRDLASGLTDMYISMVSNKMNEVMKVLTVCASIFIPLTFIAGIYGMNFDYMPELKWKYSYFVLLGIMAFTIVAMLTFFKRKKWL